MRTAPDNLDRRATLIKQLKESQHNLMNVIFAIIQEAIPEYCAVRDFRAKYPDDVLVDQINGEQGEEGWGEGEEGITKEGQEERY